MKSEKLELLLNKVVEFNQPDVAYYKGFLYKNGSGYYIKVVESTLGSFFLNDKIYLKDGDEQYIVQAEKPKLMRVSLKSWHYRLVKFVLGSLAPTPKTMQNGCPYFWLLIFSMVAVPFLLIGRAIWFLLQLIPDVLMWGLEKSVVNWVDGVNDNMAYGYWEYGSYKSSTYKFPITAKLYFDKSDGDFMQVFLREKYKLDINENPKEYTAKRKELQAKWNVFCLEREEAQAEASRISYKKDQVAKEKRKEFLRKKAIRDANWKARMKPIKKAINAYADFFDRVFTFKNPKQIIKRTKQIFGAIASLVVLVLSFVLINVLVVGLTYAIDFSITNWWIYAGIGAFAIAVGILYVLCIFFTSFIQVLVSKYKQGKKVWYIEPLIYVLYYPINYIALGMAYFFMYVIAKPAVFIFYTCLWKALIAVGGFIWGLICSLGRGVAGSTGIFGEYFSASYTDYCPGIEWADTDDEE